MRRFVYYSLFAPVALGCLTTVFSYAMMLAGQGNSGWLLAALAPFGSFGAPVPWLLIMWLPGLVSAVLGVGLGLALFALVVRRLYVSLRAGSLATPSALSGWLYALAWVPFLSLWLGLAVLAITLALRAGSGIPAGFALLPAMMLSGPMVLLAEALSLWREGRARRGGGVAGVSATRSKDGA